MNGDELLPAVTSPTFYKPIIYDWRSPPPLPESHEDRVHRLFAGAAEWLEDWAGEWRDVSIVPRGGYDSLLGRKMREMIAEFGAILERDLFGDAKANYGEIARSAPWLP